MTINSTEEVTEKLAEDPSILPSGVLGSEEQMVPPSYQSASYTRTFIRYSSGELFTMEETESKVEVKALSKEAITACLGSGSDACVEYTWTRPLRADALDSFCLWANNNNKGLPSIWGKDAEDVKQQIASWWPIWPIA